MSEEITKTATITVNLSQFTKAVMTVCAMVEAAAEQYDDVSADAFEQIQKRQSSDKKGDSNE
jgi:hypothetical protein